MLYSYDIFDTCLLRACGSSLNVFDILAQRILENNDETKVADFSKERVDGEFRARKALTEGIEEVTLKEIYDQCDFSAWTDVSKEVILTTELLIEKEFLSPVFSIREQIRYQRKSKNQIVFISDMYLPEDFIKAILKDYGFYEDNDRLYVSSQTKKSKSTGHLYELVKQECNAKYSKWIHYGDNPISDQKIPLRYGIRAKRVRHRYTYYEAKLKETDFACCPFTIAYMASISKAIVHKYKESPNILFAADFIAPLYVSYVYYLLFDAKNRGLQHLYFLSRDGYLLYCIAQKIIKTCSIFNSIDLNYLFVSRKSLYRPGLEYENGSDDIKAQSDLCYRYFKKQGLTRCGSAIIDLRGTRKCHVAINNILRRNGSCPVFAYYVEVMKSREAEGEYNALLFNERFSRNRYNNSFLPAELFEQYFSMTTQQRTSSYVIENGEVIPVFEEEVGDHDYKKRCGDVNHQVCMDFVQFMSKSNLSSIDFKSMFYAAVSVYSDFYRAPSYQYLKALEGFIVSDSPNIFFRLLNKRSFFKAPDPNGKWYFADKVYNSIFSYFWTNYYRFRMSLIRYYRG